MTEAIEISDHLTGRVGDALQADTARAVLTIAEAAARLSTLIARGPLAGAMGADLGAENAGGDGQRALDVIADEMFADALCGASVRWLASEERDAAEKLAPEGRLGVAIDPLDGSSNIDVNVSVGAIFSIMPAEATPEATFLRPGRDQLAAGYVIYGPQTALVVTWGEGVWIYTLDPRHGRFVLTDAARRIPADAAEFAINASNRRHWPAPIRAWYDDALQGADGPRGRDVNMRWVASLVAEAHRIMIRGGVFLYPGDARPGYAAGRLRMVYECAPIALLTEQAGGAATDGRTRLLDLAPDALHARTPMVFGSRTKVARIAAYHDLPPADGSPLFGLRGFYSA